MDIQSPLAKAMLQQQRILHEALEAIRGGDHAMYRQKAVELERIAVERRTASPERV